MLKLKWLLVREWICDGKCHTLLYYAEKQPAWKLDDPAAEIWIYDGFETVLFEILYRRVYGCRVFLGIIYFGDVLLKLFMENFNAD